MCTHIRTRNKWSWNFFLRKLRPTTITIVEQNANRLLYQYRYLISSFVYFRYFDHSSTVLYNVRNSHLQIISNDPSTCYYSNHPIWSTGGSSSNGYMVMILIIFCNCNTIGQRQRTTQYILVIIRE